MADKGYVTSQLNALPVEQRTPLQNSFFYLMDGWKVGTDRRAINAQWYRFTSTTSSVANTEFSFTHGLGSVPSQLFPVLDLSQVNAQLVPLQVSRAADTQRVYLKSSSTSAVFTVLVEL